MTKVEPTTQPQGGSDLRKRWEHNATQKNWTGNGARGNTTSSPDAPPENSVNQIRRNTQRTGQMNLQLAAEKNRNEVNAENLGAPMASPTSRSNKKKLRAPKPAPTSRPHRAPTDMLASQPPYLKRTRRPASRHARGRLRETDMN